MKVSVIVPAFNEEKLLPASLASIQGALSAFTRAGWESECIVCDNNSTDRTAELARQAGANVVFEALNQIGRARNAGARQASGDWFIFVDADSRPSALLFEDVIEAIERGNCLAGGSTVRLDRPHLLGDLLVRGWNFISRARRLAAGSFIFCQASAFREVGGFHPDLFVSEELDLFRRFHRLAIERGQTIVILQRHPLLTSARKMQLYTLREHARFFARTVLSFGGALKDRKACSLWYDGRR